MKLTKQQLNIAHQFSKLVGSQYVYVRRDMARGLPIAEMYHAMKYGTKREYYDIECSEKYLDRYWIYLNGDKGRKFNGTIIKGYQSMKSSYRNGLRNMGEFI